MSRGDRLAVFTKIGAIPAISACVIVRSPRLARLRNSRGALDEVDRGAAIMLEACLRHDGVTVLNPIRASGTMVV